ncbi:MAG TPA: alpha/beta hydrolase [candidate division Zixibacteria bacterium]|nr:alpha/beta hydrolase [candidate division Zixibacteria bacterium]
MPFHRTALEMIQQLAGFRVDHYPPEKTKFKSALVLVHGAWCSTEAWESWATHFCNLGWDCFAADLRRPADARLTLASWAANLRQLLAAFPFPPVLLGINVGALAALAASGRASALVLVSPSPPGNFPASRSRAVRLLSLKYSALIWLRRVIRPDGKDFDRYFANHLPPGQRAEVLSRTVPESPHIVRELLSPASRFEPGSADAPLLLLAGRQDRLYPPADAERLARWLGADFRLYDSHGHWMIAGPGEAIVRDTHRWLVQRLGDRILLESFQ